MRVSNIVLYYIILYYIILYYIVLYYIILYHIISYYIILYNIILYYLWESRKDATSKQGMREVDDAHTLTENSFRGIMPASTTAASHRFNMQYMNSNSRDTCVCVCGEGEVTDQNAFIKNIISTFSACTIVRTKHAHLQYVHAIKIRWCKKNSNEQV